MLADPQSVTIGTAISLPRTSSSDDRGAFTSADGNTKMTVSSVYGKRNRQTIRIDYQKIAADPLISAQNIVYSMSCYLVIDSPKTGFTVVERKQVADGLSTWLTASTGANLTKVLGGES